MTRSTLSMTLENGRRCRHRIPLKIRMVQDRPDALSETFIRAHMQRLPGVVGVFHSLKGFPAVDGRAVSAGRWPRARRFAAAALLRGSRRSDADRTWELALGATRANVTLAEYRTTGTLVNRACERLDTPLVVHFHGFDASRTDILERKGADYRRMFGRASAVVAVSRAMERQLLHAGCPRHKLVYNPYGVDCVQFAGTAPATAAPHFVAVGRMVEKKAPHLTIVAFARVVAECPEARLRMIGDGQLLGVCRDLAAALGIEHAVAFLGAQPHDIVAREMGQARALVQHSVIASNGDSEGTRSRSWKLEPLAFPWSRLATRAFPMSWRRASRGCWAMSGMSGRWLRTCWRWFAIRPCLASLGPTPLRTCPGHTRWNRALGG